MRKPTILCLTQDFCIGGAEIVLTNVVRYIDKKRFKCIVCCYKKSGEVIQLFKRYKAKIEILNPMRNPTSQLKGIVQKYKPSIVYVNSYKCFREALILKSLGYKIVYHVHNIFEHTHKNPRSKKMKFLCAVYCMSDQIIACSEAVRRQFDFLERTSGIVVIHNGIDIDKFTQGLRRKGKLRHKYHIPSNTRIVAVIGRIEPQKMHQLFLRICRRVKDQYEKVKFVIIGRCESRQFLNILKNDVKRLSLRRDVIFAGFRDDISDIIHDIDIVVLPSTWEAFNLSLIEGMAAGKAVVAANSGGSTELIENNKTGILVKPGSVSDFSRAIAGLLHDKERRIRLGMRAQRAVMAKYNIDLFINKIQKVFCGHL